MFNFTVFKKQFWFITLKKSSILKVWFLCLTNINVFTKLRLKNHFPCDFPLPSWIQPWVPGQGWPGRAPVPAPGALRAQRGPGRDVPGCTTRSKGISSGAAIRRENAIRSSSLLLFTEHVSQTLKNAICDAEYRAFFLCPRIELYQNEISCSFEPVSIATVQYTCDVQAEAATTSEPGRTSRAPSPCGRQKYISDVSMAHFAIRYLSVGPIYNHFIQDYPTYIW